MKRYFSALIFFALTAVILLFSGCMNKSVDSLYSLPQLPEQYIQLQKSINSILSAGADYAAPEAGDNRQAVQLQDLDGDGNDEVIAFFNITNDNKPLKIYLFEYEDGVYETSVVIEGDGVGIDSISYEDLNGDGNKEIVVGWRMSAEIKMLSVYSGPEYLKASIDGISYTSYILYDIQNDGNKDLITANVLGAETQGNVYMYSFTPDGEVVTSNDKLPYGVENVQRIKSGKLSDGEKGIYIDCGINANGVITAIYSYQDNGIKIVLSNGEESKETDTQRPYSVYSDDIDGDGIIEVPKPIELKSQSETIYYAIEWNSYDSDGHASIKCSTYHNYSDGWYIIIPDELISVLSVRREDSKSGARNMIFSVVDDDGTFVDFLEISVLSGENRNEKATENGRFILKKEQEQIFTGRILSTTQDLDFTITEENVKENFHRYYAEWVT